MVHGIMGGQIIEEPVEYKGETPDGQHWANTSMNDCIGCRRKRNKKIVINNCDTCPFGDCIAKKTQLIKRGN